MIPLPSPRNPHLTTKPKRASANAPKPRTNPKRRNLRSEFMDKQYRVTQWHEWRIGNHYLWLKGNKILVNNRNELIEVNEKGGYVKFRNENGIEHTHFSWRNRWIWASHYALADKREFGIGRIVGMGRLRKWIRWVTARRHPMHCCGNCDFYDDAIMMCFNHEQQRAHGGNCPHTDPGHWCIWWTKTPVVL